MEPFVHGTAVRSTYSCTNPKDAIGKSIAVLNLDQPSEDSISHALHQITNGGTFDAVDLKASRRNGEEFDVQSTISPIYSSAGVLGWCVDYLCVT